MTPLINTNCPLLKRNETIPLTQISGLSFLLKFLNPMAKEIGKRTVVIMEVALYVFIISLIIFLITLI